MPERKLKRKTRQKVMSEDIRRLITLRATSTNTRRVELAQEILTEIKERYPKQIPPSKETIIKIISNVRNHLPSPLDRPWNLGACREYPSFFPPESLPFLIHCIQFHEEAFANLPDEIKEVFASPLEQFNEAFAFPPEEIPEGFADPHELHRDLFLQYQKIFTIRFCIWLLRLKPLIEYFFPEDIARDKYFLENNLLKLADSYSIAEMTSEILGEDNFDTSKMDNALFSRDLESAAFFVFHPHKPSIRIHLMARPDKIDNSYKKEEY
jgi:hypothetical protein